MKNELEHAKAIAYEAGVIMRKYFRVDHQRTIKHDGSPLTIADIKINTLVIQRLTESFPDDGIIAEEESTSDYGMGRKWFCDPIDGTKAFTWGVPTAMFSLALIIDGKPVLGVAYEPMLDHLYFASEGSGAFCNDTQLHVNAETLENGILAIASSPNNILEESYIHTLTDNHRQLAVYSGAVSKATGVADGRFVGYIETKVNAYDVAAVHVIVEEAGGKVTNLDGTPYDYTQPIKGTVVSNSSVHSELVGLIKKVKNKDPL